MVKQKTNALFYACAPTIFVHDLDAAVKFYTEVLDFNMLRPIGEGNILLSGPGVTIMLRRRGEDVPAEPTRLLLGFMVSDLTTAMTKLSGRGVTFEGEIVETVAAKVAFFSDLDGTSLYVCQWK